MTTDVEQLTALAEQITAARDNHRQALTRAADIADTHRQHDMAAWLRGWADAHVNPVAGVPEEYYRALDVAEGLLRG